MVLLVDTVESEEVYSAMGWVNLGFRSGTVVGPMWRGLVYSAGGFHAVMGSAIGLLGNDVVLRLLIVERGEMEGIFSEQGAVEGGEDAREGSSLLQGSEDGFCGYGHEQEQEDHNRATILTTSLTRSSNSNSYLLNPRTRRSSRRARSSFA